MWTTTKTTLELRDLVDNVENPVDIWNFAYPSYYEGEKKKEFERKVIDHYYFREIGQETVGRWLHMFRTRIREIMPYYIQLYKSEELMNSIDDPFATVDYTETFEQTSSDSTTGSQSGETSGTFDGETSGTVNGETSNTSETTSETSGTDNRTTTEDKERKFSNTPQGSISNLDSYMTEASIEDNGATDNLVSESSGSSGTTSTGTDKQTTSGTDKQTTSGTSSLETSEEKTGTIKHTLTKKGAMGVTTFGHDMIEYRQSFLNIDLMIINELNDLFLGVY